MPEGVTGFADTGAVSGSHENVVRLATDEAAQGAVRGGASAGEVLSSADSRQGIANSVSAGGPVDVSSAATAEQLAGHISRRTGLWRPGTRKQCQHFLLLI